MINLKRDGSILISHKVINIYTQKKLSKALNKKRVVLRTSPQLKKERANSDCLYQCFSTWVPRNPEVPLIYRWVP